MCGVQNAHIGRISCHWAEPDQKPRIVAIKSILAKAGYTAPAAHIEIVHGGRLHYCYSAEICMLLLRVRG
jgi:hypothetical protein